MTDISTTVPIAIRRPGQLRLKLQKLGIGAVIAAISEDIRHAVTLAYVAPYQTLRELPPAVTDADLDGRDPSW
jgi:hypothetical protein